MKKKILLGILTLILLTVIFFAWQFFGANVKTPDKKYFFVRTGTDMELLKKELVSQKLLKTTGWFNLAAKIIGYKNIRPGRYEIKPGMSLFDLVRMLRNGQQTPVNFIVTKIRTKEALAAKIGNAFECDSLQMIHFLNSPDSLRAYEFDTTTAMAAVIPLTYSIRWNTTPGRIFQQFHLAWKNFWNEERRMKAKQLGLSPIEVATLASIIDEETNAATDRPNIASVYLNRISKGMPLQADPTVKFALKNFGLKRIYTSYTKIESPYNTYVNKGLPPGPICTPAEVTIDAVLNSPRTDYIYFVDSSAFDGTHVFTSNYTDHMKYAKLYSQELDKRNVK